MRPCIILAIIAMLALMGGSACFNMSAGTSPGTRFFLLEAKSEHTPVPKRAQKKGLPHIAIGIGPVVLPHYLDRPQILTRINNQELLADEFNRWAEPLKVSIPRILGENLAWLSGGGRIRIFPWNRSAHVNIQVSMDIHRFEADAAGKITLKATWRIVAVKDRQLLKERQSIIERASTGTGAGAKVEGMSLALSDLSLEIAGDLAGITPTQKKSTTPET